eukprot:TRINITY_DN2121_c1_g1_i1.p1 TRINITY_DN2121_c1_g1~~TRINITY_DN2121_c1_g1_i1.p1  ORF type:complete len:393 (-),score=25.19 TRINITY_DN2121_c1_g1_i1:1218-2396(-)
MMLDSRRGSSYVLTSNQRVAIGLVTLAYGIVCVDYSRRVTSAPEVCRRAQAELEKQQTELDNCDAVLSSIDGTSRGSDLTLAHPFGGKRRLLGSRDAFADLPGLPQCSSARKYDQYMDFVPRQTCPDDWPIVQDLLLDENCHSFGLPRRNCFAVAPEEYIEMPRGSQDMRWTLPDDRNVRWNHYMCKSFGCLNNRTAGDCRECFRLDGEARRWVVERAGKKKLDQVIAIKKGGLRLALDVGGGSGSFAARMAEHNVIVITTGINSGAPFLEVMAHRGVLGMQISHTARLPFFDFTLDMIHSMHSVQGLPLHKFRLMLFDWDRVLRPGGLIWIEFLYLPAEKMPDYEAALRVLGYKEWEWFMEKYLETINGQTRTSKRLSCVLEKPKTRNLLG